jgi:hypothetical protein
MKTAARQLHHLGLSLVTIDPANKRPGYRWKAFQTTREPWPAFSARLVEHPADGIGVITGAISGLAVLDIDNHAPGEFEAALAKVWSMLPAGFLAPMVSVRPIPLLT